MNICSVIEDSEQNRFCGRMRSYGRQWAQKLLICAIGSYIVCCKETLTVAPHSTGMSCFCQVYKKTTGFWDVASGWMGTEYSCTLSLTMYQLKGVTLLNDSSYSVHRHDQFRFHWIRGFHSADKCVAVPILWNRVLRLTACASVSKACTASFSAVISNVKTGVYFLRIIKVYWWACCTVS
jgi:hypothetical protein